MSVGRNQLEIGTYGDISTTRTAAGSVKAITRYRDWDGEVRRVTATASNARAAKQLLRARLTERGTASQVRRRPLP